MPRSGFGVPNEKERPSCGCWGPSSPPQPAREGATGWGWGVEPRTLSGRRPVKKPQHRRGSGGRVHGSQLGGNSRVSPQKPTRDRGWGCKSWVRTTGEEGAWGWGREPARGPTGRFPARTPLSRSHGEGLGHSEHHTHTHRGRHRVAPRELLLPSLQPDPQGGPA